MDETGLKDRLDRFGLSAFARKIAAAARPCIYLMLGEPCDAAAAGHRIGGHPYLPEGVPWPSTDATRPLTFVLQLDLATLPESFALPKAGYLGFFADDGAISMRNVAHACRLGDAASGRRPRQPPVTGSPETAVFAGMPPHRLVAVPGVDFPRWETQDYAAICTGMDEEAEQRYMQDFFWSIEPDGTPIGKLFGHVAGIGGDPRRDAETHLGTDASRWRNLLMVDSCHELGVTICDAGYLQYLGVDTEIAAHRFEALYAQIESS